MTIDTSNRIVVGVDGSAGSKNALRWAKQLSDTTGIGIDAISAWQFAPNYGWAGMPAYSPLLDVEKELTEAVDEVYGSERPKDIRLECREGPAARVLLEAARGAYMVIVGSRGHGGFAGLLLGSVSTKVAEHATCPVLVVHENEG